MDIKSLLVYTKEELAMYILKHCYFNDIEEDMKDIHIQFLLDKDRELTDKEHNEEMLLLKKLKDMPQTTLEESYKRMKVYEKYKKLSDKNTAAYNKRQAEINKLMEL